MSIFGKIKTTTKDDQINFDALQKKLNAIKYISEFVVSGENIDDVLNAINKTIPSVLEVNFILILLWNEIDESFNIVKISLPSRIVKVAEIAFGQKLENVKYTAEDTDNIFLKSIKSKKIETTLSDDLYKMLTPLVSTKYAVRLANLIKNKVAMLVSSPLLINDKVIGTLVLGWQKNHLTDIDKEIIEILTNQIGIAVHNSRLHNQVQRQLSDLRSRNKQLESISLFTNKIITFLDREKLIQNILDAISRIYGYSSAIYLEYDESANTLRPLAYSDNTITRLGVSLLNKDPLDFKVDMLDPDISDSVFVRVINENKVILTDNFNDAAKKILSEKVNKRIQSVLRIKTIAGIPIKNQNKVVGALCLVTREKKPSDFSDIDLGTISVLANQISIALDNASLYWQIQGQAKGLKERNRQLEIISQFTNSIITSLDTNSVEQNALDSIHQILGYIAGCYFKFNKKKNSLKILNFSDNRYSRGATKIIGSDPRLLEININDEIVRDSYIVKALKEDRITITDNLNQASKGITPLKVNNRIQKALGIKSIVNLPVKNKDQIVGVLQILIQTKSPQELTPLELDTMSIVTGQIGIALNNANLFKKVQKALEKTKSSNFLLSQKYQEEKDMIGILGHELRTPLGIAKNNLELLESKLEKNKEIDLDYLKSKIESIYDAILREAKIVQTALSTTHVDNNKMGIILTFIDIEDIIVNYGIKPNEKEAKRKGIDLVFIKNKNIFNPIVTDSTKIQEIVTNLISNAVKYTTHGSVKVLAELKKSHLHICVEDTGMGIPNDEIPKLGGRFHRVQQYTKNTDNNIVRPGGTGLGLYVVKAYLRALNGKLLIKSKLGKGSNFTAVIPVHVIENGEVPENLHNINEDSDLFIKYGIKL